MQLQVLNLVVTPPGTKICLMSQRAGACEFPAPATPEESSGIVIDEKLSCTHQALLVVNMKQSSIVDGGKKF